MKLKIILFSVCLLFLNLSASARVSALTYYATPAELPVAEIISSFRLYQVIADLQLSVPSVVKFPLDGSSGSFAVLETESNTFQPYNVTSELTKVPFTVESGNADDPFLNDGNNNTFAEYALVDAGGENTAVLTFSYSRPISTYQLKFSLADNVQLPDAVSVVELGGNLERILINRKALSNSAVSFPASNASSFRVIFYYRQPLRISEIGFNDTAGRTAQKYLLFLAGPGLNYHVYSSAEVVPYIRLPESADLRAGAETVQIAAPPKDLNPYFKEADSDRDGIADKRDNCHDIHNPDQADVNRNSRGDACEDFDLDGVLNGKDNCPDKPNRLQQDSDRDGAGDHCDSTENRIIERFPYLPWLGIGIGFLIVALIFKTAISPK